MTTNDLVSVIIPTYNYGNFIEECITSVLNQSYKNFEIIVVDDGSTDNTKNILQKYEKSITYIYQRNTGLSSARNTGIKNASGKFIQFLDSDDCLHRDGIGHRIKLLNENADIDVTVCKNVFFKSIPDSITNKFTPFNSWRLHSLNLDTRLFSFNIAPPHAFFLRKKVIEDIGFFDTQLKACEDYDYWFRMLQKGYVPKYSPQGLVYYRKHASSMSSKKEQQLKYDVIMHERVENALIAGIFSEHPKYFIYQMASFLGMLISLQRLRQMNLSEEAELYSHLMNRVSLIFDSLPRPSEENALETVTYLLLILSEITSNHSDDIKLTGASREMIEYMKGDFYSGDIIKDYLSNYLFAQRANLITKLHFSKWFLYWLFLKLRQL